jgi:hypothetical protein
MKKKTTNNIMVWAGASVFIFLCATIYILAAAYSMYAYAALVFTSIVLIYKDTGQTAMMKMKLNKTAITLARSVFDTTAFVVRLINLKIAVWKLKRILPDETLELPPLPKGYRPIR